MNTMKKNGGFTLVELIIVIAILAILSTGAIAGYSAYIKSANDAAVEAVLSDIYTSAVLANAETGAVTVTVKEVNATTVKVTVDGVGSKFENLFTGSLTRLSLTKDTTTSDADTYVATFTKPSAWNNSSTDYHTAANDKEVTLPVA